MLDGSMHAASAAGYRGASRDFLSSVPSQLSGNDRNKGAKVTATPIDRYVNRSPDTVTLNKRVRRFLPTHLQQYLNTLPCTKLKPKPMYCTGKPQPAFSCFAAPSLYERVALPGEALKHEPLPAEEPRHHFRELRLTECHESNAKSARGRPKIASEHEKTHAVAGQSMRYSYLIFLVKAHKIKTHTRRTTKPTDERGDAAPVRLQRIGKRVPGNCSTRSRDEKQARVSDACETSAKEAKSSPVRFNRHNQNHLESSYFSVGAELRT